MNPHKKILVVDDEIINLEFFEVMLSKLGFIVEKANDGLEALEKIKKFHPDLIMLDNIMPRMSGWELTKNLKANPAYREIPIIMLSALDQIKDKVESLELGVEDYIIKPFNFSEVLARIKVVFRNRDLLNQIQTREKHLEKLNIDIKNNIAECMKNIDELSANITETHLKETLGKIKQCITNLNERIEKVNSESKNKKNEIISANLHKE